MSFAVGSYEGYKYVGDIRGKSADDVHTKGLDAEEASIHSQAAENEEKITTNEAERNDLETQKEEQETTVEENIQTLSSELENMTQSLTTMDQAVQQANQAATTQETAAQTLYNTANSMPDMIPDPNANPKEGESVPMIPNPEKREMLQQADIAKGEAQEARRTADGLAQQEQELVKSCEELTAEIDSIEQGESSEEGESVEETDEELDANEDEYQDLQDKNDELERLLTDIQTRKQQEETKETPTYDEGMDRSVFEDGYESTEQGTVDDKGNVIYNGVTYTKNADDTYDYYGKNCSVIDNGDGTKTVTANGKVITYGNGTTTIAEPSTSTQNGTISEMEQMANTVPQTTISYYEDENGNISSLAGITTVENGKTTETAFNEDGTKTTTVKDKNGNTIYEQNTNENNQVESFNGTLENGDEFFNSDIKDYDLLTQYDRESADRDAIKSHDGLYNVENGLENEQYYGTQLDLDKYYDANGGTDEGMFGEGYEDYIQTVGKQIEEDIAANFGVDLTSENSTADMANIYREIYNNNKSSFDDYFESEYFNSLDDSDSTKTKFDENSIGEIDDAVLIDTMNRAMAYFSWDAAGLDNDYLNLTGIGYNTESSDDYALGNPDEYFGVRNESDGTFTIAGQEGLVANYDVNLDDLRSAKEGEYTLIKDGKEVTLSIKGENEGEKIYTLTEKDENNYQTITKYDSNTNEQTIRVIYDGYDYTPEVSNYRVKYNEAGEYTEYENKVIDSETGMWNVESSDGNYAYKEDIETGEYTYYPVDENGNVITKYEKSNDDITKDYSYTDKNLAIQAGNIINSGIQPMTQAEINEVVFELSFTDDLEKINGILDGINDENLASVLYEYNNHPERTSKSFFQKIDGMWLETYESKSSLMNNIAGRLTNEIESGNHLATKVFVQEQSESFREHFVEKNYNDEKYGVLSDVRKEYYREYGKDLKDAVHDDFFNLLDDGLDDNLDEAFENVNSMSYEGWVNKETNGYTDEELAEIRKQAQNTTSYVTNTFNAEAYEKDSANANNIKNTENTANTTNTSGSTSANSSTFAELNQNIDTETSEELRYNAENYVRGTTGGCLGGVDDQFERVFGVRSGKQGAFELADILASDDNELGRHFGEVKNVSRDELAKLPAGCVVVWDNNENGGGSNVDDLGKKYGHISICLGDGRESSDHIAPQITDRDANFRVFYPKKA